MAESSETYDEYLPTNTDGYLDQLRCSERYLANRERYRSERNQTVPDEYREVVAAIEAIVGPMLDWQKFYLYAVVSGRGVEWAQARGGSHYHFMGLPCSICGGGRGLGMYPD